MFTIIDNYKKLYLLTLRSNFAGGGERSSGKVPKKNDSEIIELNKKIQEKGITPDELLEIDNLNENPSEKIKKFEKDIAIDLLKKGIKLPNYIKDNIKLLKPFIERFSRMSGISLNKNIMDEIKVYEKKGIDINKIYLSNKENNIVLAKVPEGYELVQIVSNIKFGDSVGENSSKPKKPKSKVEKVQEPSFSEAQNWYKGKGAEVPQIKKIQEKLIEKGFKLEKSLQNGEFSRETFNALTKFQKDNNLKVDGIAGTKTLKKLGLIEKKQTYQDFYKKVEVKAKSTVKTETPTAPTAQVAPTESAKQVPTTPTESAKQAPATPPTTPAEKTETKKGLEKAKEELNKIFTDYTLVKTDGQYYLVGKTNENLKNNKIESLKEQIKDTKDKTVLSLEEIIKDINKNAVELAFNEELSENEKLTYLMNIGKISQIKIVNLDEKGEGRNTEYNASEENIDTINLPNIDFGNGIYEKEGFEQKIIDNLNKEIFDNKLKLTGGKTIPEIATKKVLEILKRDYGITVADSSKIIISYEEKSFSRDYAVESIGNIFDLISFEKPPIEIIDGLFTNLPLKKDIDDKKMYKVIKGGKEAIMKGSVLKELIAKNDGLKKSELADKKRNIDTNKTQLAIEKLGLDETQIKYLEERGFHITGEEKGIFSINSGEYIYDKKNSTLKFKDEVIEISDKTINGLINKLKSINNIPFKKELVEKLEKKDKEGKEKKKEKIIEELSNLKITLDKIIGKKVNDLDTNNPEDNKILDWLKGFGESDLINGIKLDDIVVNMEDKSVTFSFDNSWVNNKYNENLVIENCIKENGKLDMSVFENGLIDATKEAIKKMNGVEEGTKTDKNTPKENAPNIIIPIRNKSKTVTV